ncbi:MAG TPA: cell division protein FtsZ [Rhodospirillales bacterium]|nr:cell division protein FtsZ [Rhodospirillales bacterium]
MTINLSVPDTNGTPELKPHITVIGVGGAGGNAVNNMIQSELEGVDFVVANTDAQALSGARTDRRIQLGVSITQGLGAGSRPDVGRDAAEEVIDEIAEQLKGSNMAFIAAGMGGGTGTGAGPVIARTAREHGILTVGVVTKPFDFEGAHRMHLAEEGIKELEQYVDTLIVIPNQNLFRVANEKTTFADAFNMADEVLYSGVRGITDLMVMPGLINLDFADIRSVMSEMGQAMMGTGEAEGERRALDAAEAAISNPLLDDTSMNGAKAVLINITGGMDMTLFEADEAANRIRSEVDSDAYIIFGSTFDESLEGKMRVSVVATGMDSNLAKMPAPTLYNLTDSEEKAPPIMAPEKATLEEEIQEVAQVSRTQENPSPVSAAPAVAMEAGTKKDQGTPPPATPGVGVKDAYIPPAPVIPEASEGRSAPDPYAVAAMSNGAKGQKPEAQKKPLKKRLSLFKRVTGSRPSPEEKAETTPPKAHPGVRPQPAEAPVQTMKPAPAGQDQLGGLNPTDRINASDGGGDLLDIPAFLRRQAN